MLRNQIILILTILLIIACGDNSHSNIKPVDRTRTIELGNELVIGLENEADSVSQILGEPVGVVTDKEGNIYIGDKASLTIKVFDKDGNYLKSLGGRGRGPNEFHDISFMGLTQENNILVLDRGNFRYTTITKEGEYVDSYTIKFENQFYLKGIDFVDDKLLGLYLKQGSTQEPGFADLYKRSFFKIMSKDLETKYAEFAPFYELGIEDSFGWVTNALYQGSFAVNHRLKEIYFSPGIYTGDIYVYREESNGDWKLDQTFNGTPTHFKPYVTYNTESEYESNKDYPAVSRTSFSGAAHRGRVYSINTGLFVLPAKKKVIHFYGEWREGDVSMEEGNPLDIFVQIFDRDGNILQQSYLFSLEYDRTPRYPFVNWMDKDENFYLIDYSDSAPVVRRFNLDL